MKFTRIILQTSNPSRLASFYSGLGLTIAKDGDSHISMAIGSTQLVFLQASTAGPFYHFAITIPANKIGEARDWLIKKNITPAWIADYKSDIADFVNWHAKSVYFTDPAGNIVELIARFDLGNEDSSAFSAAQFLCISEIGIVAPENDLEMMAQKLLDDYGLSWFAKQPPLPHFKVIGDDNGLLILVPEGRNWYPTSIPSQLFSAAVYFTEKSKTYFLKT